LHSVDAIDYNREELSRIGSRLFFEIEPGHEIENAMSKASIPLDMISVASPCHADWDDMSGNDQSRFCGQCSKHVYNLSAMTAGEAQDLIEENEGKMCVRFYKRADGTMLTADCPVGWRAAKQRFLIFAGAAAAFLFAVFGMFTAGIFAASVRGNGRGGVQFVNPITRFKEALFGGPPQPMIMGEAVPIGIGPANNQVPDLVMGKMCPPQLQPPIDVPVAPPMPDAK